MRILQVVADGTPGGGTTCVLQLVSALLLNGHEVHFVSQKNSYAIDQAKQAGAYVYDDIDFFASRFSRKVPQDISRVIGKVKPEIIHLHGGRAGYFGTRSSVNTQGASCVYTVHGYHFQSKSFLLKFLAARAELSTSKRVDHIVFVSRYDSLIAKTQRFINDHSKHSIIYNGVSTLELPETQRSVQKHNRVIAVGRLTEQKDPFKVLEIAAKFTEDGIQFMLVGGGDMEKQVREKVAAEQLSNVEVVGAVSRIQTLELLAQSRVFLLASRWEGLPIAPMEAMQAGVPTVLSKVGGSPELIEHGVSGFLANQSEVAEYESHIRLLLSNPAVHNSVADAAKRRVAERFSLHSMLASYEKLYQQENAKKVK